MSDEEELQKIREQRLREIQQQQAMNQQQDMVQQQQQQAFEAQKQMILSQILSSEARSRLANIKLARSEFAEQLEMQLIQTYQSGGLRGRIPISDELLKSLLMQLQKKTQRREGTITFR